MKENQFKAQRIALLPFFIYTGLLCLCPSEAQAQDPAYQEWLKKQNQSYTTFLKEQDEAFSAMLKREWKLMGIKEPESAFREEKLPSAPSIGDRPEQGARSAGGAGGASPVISSPGPEARPPSEMRPRPETSRPSPNTPDASRPAPDARPSPVSRPAAETRPAADARPAPETRMAPETRATPVTPTAAPATPAPARTTTPAPARTPAAPPSSSAATTNSANISFHGTSVRFPLVSGYESIPSPSSIDKKGIAEWWDQMAGRDSSPILKSLADHSLSNKYNDWAYLSLVWSAAESLTAGDKVKTPLLAWFLLIQSGFDAKIGYENGVIHLMHSSRQKLFGLLFLTFDDKRYYLLDMDRYARAESGSEPYGGRTIKGLSTYQGEYDRDMRSLSMEMTNAPAFAQNTNRPSTKTFVYKAKSYSIEFPAVNLNRIGFYYAYPQADLDVLLNAAVAQPFADELLSELRVPLSRLSGVDQVNFLLRFVQTAFDYQVDGDQFGREKHLFPEETFYYPYSDCEDRAALFAFLVRELLDLPVVGLHYPGHVATAVAFPGSLQGDRISYKGKTYYVADPTYINADIGMEMPRYQDVDAKVIEITR